MQALERGVSLQFLFLCLANRQAYFYSLVKGDQVVQRLSHVVYLQEPAVSTAVLPLLAVVTDTCRMAE